MAKTGIHLVPTVACLPHHSYFSNIYAPFGKNLSAAQQEQNIDAARLTFDPVLESMFGAHTDNVLGSGMLGTVLSLRDLRGATNSELFPFERLQNKLWCETPVVKFTGDQNEVLFSSLLASMLEAAEGDSGVYRNGVPVKSLARPLPAMFPRTAAVIGTQASESCPEPFYAIVREDLFDLGRAFYTQKGERLLANVFSPYLTTVVGASEEEVALYADSSFAENLQGVLNDDIATLLGSTFRTEAPSVAALDSYRRAVSRLAISAIQLRAVMTYIEAAWEMFKSPAGTEKQKWAQMLGEKVHKAIETDVLYWNVTGAKISSYEPIEENIVPQAQEMLLGSLRKYYDMLSPGQQRTSAYPELAYAHANAILRCHYDGMDMLFWLMANRVRITDLHDENWGMALTKYNHGAPRIRLVIRDLGFASGLGRSYPPYPKYEDKSALPQLAGLGTFGRYGSRKPITLSGRPTKNRRTR